MTKHIDLPVPIEARLARISQLTIEELPDRKEAMQLWARTRADHGFSHTPTKIISIEQDSKTSKNPERTGIIYLTPHTRSGFQLCPWATPGCAEACLYTAGHGRFAEVQRARLARTNFLYKYPAHFFRIVVEELIRSDLRWLRMNGTSDIRWERGLPQGFEDLLSAHNTRMYDYTKASPGRLHWLLNYRTKLDYTLIYSVSERDTDFEVIHRANTYGYAAVVSHDTPSEWLGITTTPADYHDLWWLDRDKPLIGILRPKGRALTDTSGFVRSLR